MVIDFQLHTSLKKTLSRPQTQIIKGVRIILNKCNPHTFSGLGITVKKTTYVNYPEKQYLLPTKLPNEF
jgi:hypothetical protein